MNSYLLLLGASVRAAAQSARRARLIPWGADLFCDMDLKTLGAFQSVADYPNEFFSIAKQGPPGPWLYTGALENWPRLVDAIAGIRPLWGNTAAVLRRVRSPMILHRKLTAAGIPCPGVRLLAPDGGRWLIKPRRGGGGREIDFWRPSVSTVHSPRQHFFQEYIEGEPCAAIFLAHENHAALLGVTRQLVGQDWLNAGAFQYCGSIGPLVLDADQQRAFERLGNALAAGFRLRGLFGVDCVLRDGLPVAVEVNPRYTASVEVLELATGSAFLQSQQRVFEDATGPLASAASRAGMVAKAILFAKKPLLVPGDGPWRKCTLPPDDPWTMPAFADIPPAGQSIRERQPILTFFTRADSPAACLAQLQHIARDLDRWLYTP
jgi:predicted ATP-grasp superfamily ATP-dependent carboligase